MRLSLFSLAVLAACLDLPAPGERSTASLRIEQNDVQDHRTLPLDDLVWGTDGLFPEAVNARLDATPPGEIERSATDLYGLAGAAASHPVRDIAALSNLLSERFGDTALPAQLAQMRTRELQAGRAGTFGDNSFVLHDALGPDAQVDVEGLGADASERVAVGLRGANLQIRAVTAFDDLDTATADPLGAIRARRGSVLPTSLAHVKDAMLPGECVALRGTGDSGFNFGLDTRVLVQNPLPGGERVYGAILNGGLRVVVHSEHMDLQLCRLGGDQATIEIGLGEVDVRSAHLADTAGHGLRGPSSATIRLGGTDLDARTVLDGALRDELQRRLETFTDGRQLAGNRARESLARFRVDLDTRDPRVLAAVEQFLHGDLRLAQALAQRETAGIASELDVTRIGHTVTGGLGFGGFGLSFVDAFASQRVDFSVQTPGGSLRGLAQKFDLATGGFFSRHGYARTVLSGIETPREGTADAQTSLYLSWRDEDDYMERAKFQRNLGGMLTAIVGADGFAPIRGILDAIAATVQDSCEPLQWERGGLDHAPQECITGLVASPAVTTKVDDAREALTAALDAAAVPSTERTVATSALELAIASARTYETPAMLIGPPTTFTTDAWLSDAAIEDVMSHSGDDFARMVAAIEPSARAEELSGIAATFDEVRLVFNDLSAIAEEEVDRVGSIGFDVLTVSIPMRGGRPVYDDLVVRSLVEMRAAALVEGYDRLRDRIGRIRRIHDRSERALGYALVGLSASAHRDVLLHVRSSLQDRWSQFYDRYRAAGNLDGALTLRHRGEGVRHFGEGIGWDVQGILRLIEDAAQ